MPREKTIRTRSSMWQTCAALLVIGGICACDTIDCSLNNTVVLGTTFYQGTNRVVLNDILTVTACGTDSVLINKLSGASSLELPMSYTLDVDSFVFTIEGEDYSMQDTLWVKKTNTPHFESPDCPSHTFHKILEVGFHGSFIDSVHISSPLVNYDKIEHIQIFLPAAD